MYICQKNLIKALLGKLTKGSSSNKGNKLLDKLRTHGYRVNVISLKNDYNNQAKEMLTIEIKAPNLKKVSNIVKSIDENAYMVVRDTKVVSNGVFK